MRRDTPGPPLMAEPEYCATAAPSLGGYARGILFGLLTGTGGGAIWFVLVDKTRPQWGLVALGLGLACGHAVHHGAHRLRSKGTGVIASVCTLLGLLFGYYLAFKAGAPSPEAPPILRASLDLLFILAALIAAYRSAGPKREKPLGS